MNVKEVRDLSNEELEKEVVSLKEELYELRFALATGTLENPARIRDSITGKSYLHDLAFLGHVRR